MEIGNVVITLVDKKTKERNIDVFIPVNTEGVVCDVSNSFVFVEINTNELPEGTGVFAYEEKDLKIVG